MMTAVQTTHLREEEEDDTTVRLRRFKEASYQSLRNAYE